MKLLPRVKSLTLQRLQRRALTRQREKELLITDVLSGLEAVKAGRVYSEAEFRRWTEHYMTTPTEQPIGKQLSGDAERPSEDFSRSWQMRKSPSCGAIFSGPTTGKWCVFVPSFDVDSAWARIKGAVEADRLVFAKVSTALRSKGRDGHVICVYTRDWTDRQDLLRTREVLRSLGFVEELGYKRDVDTLNRIYGPDEWFLRA